MYFKKVEICNYGCISNFEYEFRFDQYGNPIPCVVIGENGKGKTLLLTNLVDSAIEIKRKIYGETLLETQEHKYFKIGSKSYIKNGSSFSKVMVESEYKKKINCLYDVASKNPSEDIMLIDKAILDNVKKFEQNGFSKKTICNIDETELNEEILLYFPADRYYYPQWFNKSNSYIYHTEVNNNVNEPKSNIIKTNLLSEIKSWLIDIFLEKTVQIHKFGDEDTIAPNLRGRYFNLLIESDVQKIVKQIFSIIKNNNNINTPIGMDRKSKMLGFTSNDFSCHDISQLSEGEMNLFAIMMSILKEWDINHHLKDLNQISGVVIIDEVDLGLHIDYAYRALPSLMKLFPKIQFILTSHSPFFLSGLVQQYGESIDIIAMPDGLRITDINSFSEIKKAQDIFLNNVQELRASMMVMKNELEILKRERDKIVIYTEGKTDAKYLKYIIKKYKEDINYKDFIEKVEVYDVEQDNKSGDNELNKKYEYFQKGNDLNIKICMFDRDVSTYIIDGEFDFAPNRVYKFNIPIPSHRKKEDLISIEHYFTDDDLSSFDSDGRKLFMAKDFFENGLSFDSQYIYQYVRSTNNPKYNPLEIIDGSDNKRVYKSIINDKKNYALSKDAFANHVVNNDEGFNFNTDAFKMILDVIKNIINHAEQHR